MCVSYGSIFAKGEVLVEFKLACVMVLILEMGWHHQEYFILGSSLMSDFAYSIRPYYICVGGLVDY